MISISNVSKIVFTESFNNELDEVLRHLNLAGFNEHLASEMIDQYEHKSLGWPISSEASDCVYGQDLKRPCSWTKPL